MEQAARRRLGRVAAIGSMLAAALCAALTQPWQLGLAGHDGGSQTGSGNQIGSGNVGPGGTGNNSGSQNNGQGPQNNGPGAQNNGPGAQNNGPGAQNNGPGAQNNGPGAQNNGSVSQGTYGPSKSGSGLQNNGTISTDNHPTRHDQQNTGGGQQNNGGTVYNYPTPALTGGEAQIEDVIPADGRQPMGPAAIITLFVKKLPNNGNTLFLACDLIDRAGRAHLWFAKQEILVSGRQSITVAANHDAARDPSLIGTIRLCTVITADEGATAKLRYLMQMDEAGIQRDPVTGNRYDADRAALPPGAAPISNQVIIKVERIITDPTPALDPLASPKPHPAPTPTR